MSKAYKDIYSENGIASIFNANYSTDFNTLFGGNTAAAVDGFILHRYANKPLTPNIDETNAVNVVISVIAVRLEVWRKMYAALSAQYNAANSLNETRTKTGTLQRSANSTNTNVNAEKAFNDTEFVSDTQNTQTNTGLNTDSYNLTETVTATNGNAAESVKNEIALRQRNNLQIAIIDAIINEITLLIY